VRGGNEIEISGSNFRSGLTVTIGGLSASILSAAGTSPIRVRVPEGTTFGAVPVTVSQPGGSDTLPGAYTYGENPVAVDVSGATTLGDAVEFVVYGPAGADYGLAIGRNPGPSSAKGIEFCWARDAELVMLGTSFRGRTPRTGPLSSIGKRVIAYAIPYDPSLIFSNLYVQGAVDVDLGSGKSFVATNCLTITVFP
jgi:hypothetical protein